MMVLVLSVRGGHLVWQAEDCTSHRSKAGFKAMHEAIERSGVGTLREGRGGLVVSNKLRKPVSTQP